MNILRDYCWIITTAVIVTMASCNKDTMPAGIVSSRLIHPVVRTSVITKAGGEQVLGNLESDGFMMDIIAEQDYIDGSKGLYGGVRRDVTHSAGKWNIEGNPTWVNDIKMSFWAYNNAIVDECECSTPVAGATQLSMSYPKAGHNADGQTDLLLAYSGKTHDGNDKHNKGDSYDQIELNFKHAMSKICFAGTVTGIPAGYSVSGITISGLKTNGTLNFTASSGAIAWSGLNGTSTFSVTNTSGSILVIPQNGRTNGATIQLELSHATNPSVVLSAALGDWEMKAGYKYEYSLAVTDGRELAVTCNVLPWDLEDRQLEIKNSNVTQYLNASTYTNATVDVLASKVFIKNGMAVHGQFQLSSPKGAKLLLALDGNLDAFEVKPKTTFIGDGPVEFTIEPLVKDPKMDYKTSLHIYLINPDSNVSDLDELVMQEGGVYKHYTIVLPRQ